MQKLVTVLITCMGLLSLSHASSKKYKSTFSILPTGEVNQDLYYLNGKEVHKIEFKTRKRSQTYPTKLGKPLQLFIRNTAPDAENPFILVAQSKSIIRTPRTLFFIKPAKKGSDLPLELEALNDGLDEFPKGAFRYINLTKASLVIECGGVEAVLPAYGDTVVKPNIPKNAGSMPIIVKTKKGQRILGGQTYGIPGDRKMILIKATGKAKAPIALINIPQAVHPNMF